MPESGIVAAELAETIGLDTGSIEGVFVNHVLGPVTVRVMPGDRVAFVPYGTPGPHRFYLGLYDAGKAPGAHDSE